MYWNDDTAEELKSVQPININMRCIEMPVWENALDVIDD